MQITVSGTQNISIEFLGAQGQLVVPDTGTFTYSINRLGGASVVPPTTPTLGANDTETVITVASPVTDTLGTYVLDYSYQVKSSLQQSSRVIFQVIEPKLYITTPEDVRRALGATDLILPDESIDIYSEYIRLKNSDDFTDFDLDVELLAGGYRALVANDLLKLAAARSALNGLRLNRMKTHTEDNISVTLFEMNIEQIAEVVNSQYYAALATVSPAAKAALQTVSSLFVISRPDPDVVTNQSET